MGHRSTADHMRGVLGNDQVRDGTAVERVYACDSYSIERHEPECVVFPRNTYETQLAVQRCIEIDVPFTARGAGTGLSGGVTAVKGGVIVSTKRMNQILEVDPVNRCTLVQAGVVNQKVNNAVKPFGLMFAPDPSSQTVCTIGGNINENSGGPHTLKYGVTADHVLQATLVDSRAQVIVAGSRVSGGPGIDPLSLVVGSEGTLGIVTEAWLRLVPMPERVETALIAFSTIRSAVDAVVEVMARGVIPAALEMMDKHVLSAVEKAFGLDYPKGSEALLLIECDGRSQQAESEIRSAIEACLDCGATNVETAGNEEDRKRLWTARKKGIGAMGRLAPTIVTHDGVIPRSRLPEMLEFVYAIAEENSLGVANIFHAGDGNLHPCFYFDEREPGTVERVLAAGEAVLDKCVELGGSVTGEHGIGLEKIDSWSKGLSANDLRLQTTVREAFDVSGLCNPCKVIPNQKGCVEHRRRWSGAAT
jgi:glycolate oxidase